MAILNDAMLLLAAQPNALFLGQGVGEGGDGVATFKDFDGIPMRQRIELPVCEELQMGMGVGLALQGYLPILVYPRCDFLLRAMDQLVLHLDKIERMSRGEFKPKVIIRTRVGSKTPLDAGPQHTNDWSEPLRLMLTTVQVVRVERPEFIVPVYQGALECEHSTLVVEALA